jgi:hypothetical protein
LNCPRCGRHNAADALFCSRCGLRLGGRASGVTYRQRQQSGGFGIGQGLLALIVVLLAGLVVAGGAFAIVFLGRPQPLPTGIAILPTPTATPFVTFVPPSPSPTLSPSPTPFVFPTPSLIPSGSPSISPTLPPTLPPTIPPTASPTPRPTRTPGPTPPPTPEPTPFNCAAATGADLISRVIGFGNPNERGPQAGRGWCVDRAVFRMVLGSTFGVVHLYRNSRELASVDCTSVCPAPIERAFDPAVSVRDGQVLRYVFECVGDPSTPEVDECSDGTPDGATIEFFYEVLDAP